MKTYIRYKRIHTILYFNLFLCISTLAQSDSLFHYLEIAAKNNPTVLQKYYEYQSALQKVPQVGGLPDPELSAGVYLSPMEQLSGNQVADFRLMQMFPWFGVLKYAKDEMSLMAMAKYESFRDAKLQLFFDVQSNWYQLYRIDQNIRIAQQNITLLQTLERLALVKFKASPISGGTTTSAQKMASGNTQSTAPTGMGSMGGGANASPQSQPAPTMSSGSMGQSSGGSGLVDVYRIQMEIGELSNNIELLKNQRNTAMASFNAFLNRPPDAAIQTPDTLAADTLGLPLEAVTDSMLANHPMLGMLKYEQQSLDARKKMVSRMGYPMVGIGVNYALINKSDMSTSAMNGQDMVMPMVTVTLPIYRKKYKSMVAEAELSKAATDQASKATTNALQTEYYQAVQQYTDAQRRMALYNNQNLLAHKTLDIMVKGFSASGIELAEVLRTQQQTLDYEMKQIEALVDYNTAIAWLKRLQSGEGRE